MSSLDYVLLDGPIETEQTFWKEIPEYKFRKKGSFFAYAKPAFELYKQTTLLTVLLLWLLILLASRKAFLNSFLGEPGGRSIVLVKGGGIGIKARIKCILWEARREDKTFAELEKNIPQWFMVHDLSLPYLPEQNFIPKYFCFWTHYKTCDVCASFETLLFCSMVSISAYNFLKMGLESGHLYYYWNANTYLTIWIPQNYGSTSVIRINKVWMHC